MLELLGTEVLALEFGEKPPPAPKKDKGPALRASGSLQGSELAGDGQTHLGVGFTPTGGGR